MTENKSSRNLQLGDLGLSTVSSSTLRGLGGSPSRSEGSFGCGLQRSEFKLQGSGCYSSGFGAPKLGFKMLGRGSVLGLGEWGKAAQQTPGYATM